MRACGPSSARAAVPPRPEHDIRRGRRTLHFVRRRQRPAEQRRHAGERKRRRRDLRHAQGFDAAFAREHVALAHARGAEFHHRLERPPPDREIVEHPRLHARRRRVLRLEAHDSTAFRERQPFVQQFAGDFDADHPNRDGRRQRKAADDRERGTFQQQTRAQLPVEPRNRGQAGIHTRHSSRPPHAVHRAMLIELP